MNTTYEDLLEEAQRKSVGGWAAVVDITAYMGRSFTTIAVSRMAPIVSQQRGGEFVGVVAQFRDGKPMGRLATEQAPADMAFDTDAELPF